MKVALITPTRAHTDEQRVVVVVARTVDLLSLAVIGDEVAEHAAGHIRQFRVITDLQRIGQFEDAQPVNRLDVGIDAARIARCLRLASGEHIGDGGETAKGNGPGRRCRLLGAVR